MERHRGEIYGDHMDPQHKYRPFLGGPQSTRPSPLNPIDHYQHRNPNSYSGLDRGDLAFDIPRFHPGAGGPGAGGFPPIGGGFLGENGGGGYNSGHQMPPVSGQKRAHPFSGRGGSPEHIDGGSFAKLFVGSVPRTVTEDDIRPVFEAHGCVLEVAVIKDKRTGQPQGCCFIKYATSEDADRAIRALHNNYTLPGGIAPIQVRYADGERERLGTVEYKLFVGSLSKQASVKDVEEIFSPYGRVEDVYLMRDEMKQSRGCGFVKYSNREVALAAIDGLNGKFTMRGCDQPLIVRFADPKKPKFGESRDPSFVGPGYGPRFQAPGIRPPHLNLTEPTYGQNAPNSWRPMPSFNPSQVSNAINTHGFGNQVSPRSNDIQGPSSLGGRGASGDNSFPMRPVPSPSMTQQGGHSSSGDSSYPGLPVSSSSSSMSQKGSNQPLVQSLSIGQQNSPSQKPLPSPQHFPSSLQQQKSPMLHGYGHPDTRIHGYGQPQVPIIHPSAGQAPVGKAMTPQQNVPSGQSNQQHQAQQTIQHQPPSQLAQMMSQQTQTLQASFQSSQQAFSQLQHQQRQMMQPPSNQSSTTPQLQQHSSWSGHAQQQPPSVTSFQSPPLATSQPVAALKCDWTEHTAPDGYKYYHNSVTGESKWEKPEELTLFEQQQQKQQEQTKPSSTTQQPQMQSYPQQGISPQQAFHMQGQYQSPLQIQFRAPQQLQQQTSQALSYHQDPGRIVQRSNQEHSYAHLPHAAGSVNDTLHIQQGLHAGQEWMSKRT